MNDKMYIPCNITLTEHEYLLIQHLAHQLAPSSYAFSAAIRQIIREWELQHRDRPAPFTAPDTSEQL